MLDHHVDAAPLGELANRLGDVFAVVIDGEIRAQGEGFGQFLLAAGGGNDPAMEHLGDLDGGRTDAAGRRQHQHILARLEARAGDEHVPGGEEHHGNGGGLLEGEVAGDADGAVLGGGQQFGVAAVAAVAEGGEAAAEIVLAAQASLALAATESGREQHAPSGLHPAAQRAHLDNLARDVAAQHMRHGEPHAGDARAHEEVEVVQGAGAHADEDFVGLDGGLGRRFVNQLFRAAVPVNAGEVHGGCQLTVYRRGKSNGPPAQGA